MDNEDFKQKVVLLLGNTLIGIAASIFLAAVGAASQSMSQSEAMTFGIPLLLAALLTFINTGCLCCLSGGKELNLLCRLSLALAIFCLLFVVCVGMIASQ